MSEMMREPDRNPEVDPTHVEHEPEEDCNSLLNRLEDDVNTQEIINQLFMAFRADPPICEWLRTPSTLLQDITPLDAIEAGLFDEVLDAVLSIPPVA